MSDEEYSSLEEDIENELIDDDDSDKELGPGKLTKNQKVKLLLHIFFNVIY